MQEEDELKENDKCSDLLRYLRQSAAELDDIINKIAMKTRA